MRHVIIFYDNAAGIMAARHTRHVPWGHIKVVVLRVVHGSRAIRTKSQSAAATEAEALPIGIGHRVSLTN